MVFDNRNKLLAIFQALFTRNICFDVKVLRAENHLFVLTQRIRFSANNKKSLEKLRFF